MEAVITCAIAGWDMLTAPGRSAKNGIGFVGDGSTAGVNRTFQRFMIIERDHQVVTWYRVGALSAWFARGMEWARHPVIPGGRAAPLTAQAAEVGSVDGDQVSDVLVQQAATADEPADIPWDALISYSTPRACFRVGLTAYFDAQQPIVAIQALTKAADDSDAEAMTTLGLLLKMQGEDEEAERRLRQAAEAGNTSAMAVLGLLLAERGEEVEGERWLRQAAEAGETTAMGRLGILLVGRREEVEAERWLRQAAEAGGSPTVAFLSLWLAERGEEVEGQRWLRQGAEAGSTDAMRNLGVLLVKRGEEVEAERWLRQAGKASDTAPTDAC